MPCPLSCLVVLLRPASEFQFRYLCWGCGFKFRVKFSLSAKGLGMNSSQALGTEKSTMRYDAISCSAQANARRGAAAR